MVQGEGEERCGNRSGVTRMRARPFHFFSLCFHVYGRNSEGVKGGRFIMAPFVCYYCSTWATRLGERGGKGGEGVSMHTEMQSSLVSPIPITVDVFLRYLFDPDIQRFAHSHQESINGTCKKSFCFYTIFFLLYHSVDVHRSSFVHVPFPMGTRYNPPIHKSYFPLSYSS